MTDGAAHVPLFAAEALNDDELADLIDEIAATMIGPGSIDARGVLVSAANRLRGYLG